MHAANKPWSCIMHVYHRVSPCVDGQACLGAQQLACSVCPSSHACTSMLQCTFVLAIAEEPTTTEDTPRTRLVKALQKVWGGGSSRTSTQCERPDED